MSEENMRPENLLLEVRYDAFKFTLPSPASDMVKGKKAWFGKKFPLVYLEQVVAPIITELMMKTRCGIVIEPAKDSDGETVIQVYKLGGTGGVHIYPLDGHHLVGSWFTAMIVGFPFRFVADKELAMTAFQEEPPAAAFALPKFRHTSPTPTLPDVSTRIQALKGVFALATANYDGVTGDDIRAAVDAGYADPEVLSGIGHSTWLVSEKHRDASWQQGFDKGYEAKAETLVDSVFPKGKKDFDTKVKLLMAFVTGDFAFVSTGDITTDQYMQYSEIFRDDHWGWLSTSGRWLTR